MTYMVYGDYALDTQCELYSHNSLEFVRRWLDGYIRWGDFGGYEQIYIVDGQGKIYKAVYANNEEMV